LYRSQLVIEYFAEDIKRDTPIPFCEIRVFVITKKRIDPKNILKKLLLTARECEWLFLSLREARTQETIFIKMKAEEMNAYVEEKEAVTLISANIHPIAKFIADPKSANRMTKRNLKKYINKIFKYVAFYDTDGNLKNEWNDWKIENFVRRDALIFPPPLEEFLKDTEKNFIDAIKT